MPYYDMPTTPKPPSYQTHVRYYSFDVGEVVETIVSGHLTLEQSWKIARHSDPDNILSSYSHVTTTQVREVVENI